VKPEILTSYIYGPTFGNAESRLFLFSAQCFNTEQCRKLSCGKAISRLARFLKLINPLFFSFSNFIFLRGAVLW
jgi:hypothetical protein